MAIREIAIYPERADVLRRESNPVGSMTRQVERLVQDLQDTLNAHEEGIGLSAPQIGVNTRVVVVRLVGQQEESEPGPPLALINPEIVEARDERRDFDGCLSRPGLHGETVRPHYVRLTGLDAAGCLFDEVFEGLDAVVVQNEVDHLDGVPFIDRVEKREDLYHVRENEDGELVRVPLSAEGSKAPETTKAPEPLDL